MQDAQGRPMSDENDLPGSVTMLAAVRPPSAIVLDRARTDLAERIAGESLAQRQRLSRRRVLTAAATVLLTGGAVGVAAGRHLGRRPAEVSAPAPAVETLDQLLEQVRSQPNTWRDSAYWYTRSIEPNGLGNRKYAPMQFWTGHDQQFCLDQVGGSTRTTPILIGRTTFLLGFPGQKVTWDGLFDVTTDPDALTRQMRAHSDVISGDPGGAVAISTQNLLSAANPLPSALRTTLIQMFAALPRATVYGPVTDSLGRRGFAIDYRRLNQDPAENHVERSIFDPVTGFLNESQDRRAGDQLIFSTITVSRGPVASLNDTVPVPAALESAIATLNADRS